MSMVKGVPDVLWIVSRKALLGCQAFLVGGA
jgi:hypothetical protein